MDDPLLDKLQTLMGKYQQPVIARTVPQPADLPVHADNKAGFPILTDIVQLGDAVFHGNLPDLPAPPDEPPSTTLHSDSANQIAQQILNVIDAQLQNQVDRLVTPRLQQAMDEVLATLLPQLMINIESIVHETLVKEFAHHGIPLKRSKDSV